MRILGIDPGIGRMGWGIIEKNGHNVASVAFGCVTTESSREIPQRLFEIHTAVEGLINSYIPNAFAIEELFFNTNAKTAFTVGQARGVILLAAAQKGLAPAIYTPLQVKIALTGYGRAEKRQVGEMVKATLSLPKIPTPDDTADALAVAITHAFSVKQKRVL